MKARDIREREEAEQQRQQATEELSKVLRDILGITARWHAGAGQRARARGRQLMAASAANRTLWADALALLEQHAAYSKIEDGKAPLKVRLDKADVLACFQVRPCKHGGPRACRTAPRRRGGPTAPRPLPACSSRSATSRSWSAGATRSGGGSARWTIETTGSGARRLTRS